MRMRMGSGVGSKNITTKLETGFVEAARARVPSLCPHGQSVPDCACRFCVSAQTLQQCGARKE